MPDPTTINKFLAQPTHGSDVDAWDVPMNGNFGNIDQAFGAYTTLNVTGFSSGPQALTTSQTIPLGYIVTGTPIDNSNINFQVPAGQGGFWVARNQTSGVSVVIGFSSLSGGSTVNIPAGTNVPITADGSALGMVPVLTATGAAAGSNQQIQLNALGNLGASAGLTFDGVNLNTTGLNVSGNTTMGLNLSTPNNITVNSGQLFLNYATGQFGIGVSTSLTALLTVNGTAQFNGAVTFPNGVAQNVAWPGSYLTNSLVSNVSLNSISTYFDGPVVAQGTSGTWSACGQVLMQSGAASDAYRVILWDGTTIFDSVYVQTYAAAGYISASVSGFIVAPAGNIRISVEPVSRTDGAMGYNVSGNSKDCTITAIRLA